MSKNQRIFGIILLGGLLQLFFINCSQGSYSLAPSTSFKSTDAGYDQVSSPNGVEGEYEGDGQNIRITVTDNEDNGDGDGHGQDNNGIPVADNEGNGPNKRESDPSKLDEVCKKNFNKLVSSAELAQRSDVVSFRENVNFEARANGKEGGLKITNAEEVVLKDRKGHTCLKAKNIKI